MTSKIVLTLAIVLTAAYAQSARTSKPFHQKWQGAVAAPQPAATAVRPVATPTAAAQPAALAKPPVRAKGITEKGIK